LRWFFRSSDAMPRYCRRRLFRHYDYCFHSYIELIFAIIVTAICSISASLPHFSTLSLLHWSAILFLSTLTWHDDVIAMLLYMLPSHATA
jgi:hypothetical protein